MDSRKQLQDLQAADAPNQRRYRRFDLRYPVRVRFSSGDSAAEVQMWSQNVSVGGLLLQSDSPIPPKTDVRFVITVRGGQLVRPILMKGEGQVVRLEREKSLAGFSIAVRCKRPIAEINHLLSV